MKDEIDYRTTQREGNNLEYIGEKATGEEEETTIENVLARGK